jgi:hypothetical protein
MTALGKAISDLMVPPAKLEKLHKAEAEMWADLMKERSPAEFWQWLTGGSGGGIQIVIDNKNGSAVSVNGQPVNQSGKTTTQLR